MSNTHVVIPCLAPFTQIELDACIGWLIGAREFDALRLDVSIPQDLNIEAVGVELGAAKADGQHGIVAVESQEFGAEDVHSRLDVAWKLHDIRPVVVQDLFVGPLLLGLEIAVTLDLEELDVLGLDVGSWDGSKVLHRGESASVGLNGCNGSVRRAQVRCACESFRSNGSPHQIQLWQRP